MKCFSKKKRFFQIFFLNFLFKNRDVESAEFKLTSNAFKSEKAEILQTILFKDYILFLTYFTKILLLIQASCKEFFFNFFYQLSDLFFKHKRKRNK
jgi:hypothetical protein